MRSGFVSFLFVVTAVACGDATETAFRNEAHPSAAGGSAGVSGAVGAPAGNPAIADGGGASVLVPSSSGGAPGAGGAATGAGGTAARGAGGTLTPIMTSGTAGYPYDPGVTFDWPSTMPMAGKCQPGTYSGQFSCDVDEGLFGKVNFTGPVSFTLTASPAGEFLEITNGMLVGNGNGIPFMGDLVGKLDCNTNAFTATTSNGTATILIFPTPVGGTLEGHLDRLTQTLAGTWTLGPDSSAFGSGGAAGAGGAAAVAFGCTGTWSVVRQ
jgi:hypothetical protein